MESAASGHLAAVKLLFKAQATVGRQDVRARVSTPSPGLASLHWCPLHLPPFPQAVGRTALHSACARCVCHRARPRAALRPLTPPPLSGRASVADFLLRAEADVNARDVR